MLSFLYKIKVFNPPKMLNIFLYLLKMSTETKSVCFIKKKNQGKNGPITTRKKTIKKVVRDGKKVNTSFETIDLGEKKQAQIINKNVVQQIAKRKLAPSKLIKMADTIEKKINKSHNIEKENIVTSNNRIEKIIRSPISNMSKKNKLIKIADKVEKVISTPARFDLSGVDQEIIDFIDNN